MLHEKSEVVTTHPEGNMNESTDQSINENPSVEIFQCEAKWMDATRVN